MLSIVAASTLTATRDQQLLLHVAWVSIHLHLIALEATNWASPQSGMQITYPSIGVIDNLLQEGGEECQCNRVVLWCL